MSWTTSFPCPTNVRPVARDCQAFSPVANHRRRGNPERVSTPPTAPWNEHAGRRFSLSATVLEAQDANVLADFYRRLLGWPVIADEPGWVMLRPPGGGSGLSFSSDPQYRAPVWPATADENQMQLHLDIRVDDLAEAVEHALATGARLADFQPQEDVRVLLDPAGHPFCFFEN